MNAELSTRAVALVDSDQASRGVLELAHALTGPVTVLATVDTKLANNEPDVVRSLSAEPSMTEVLALAAQRNAPWVIMRRSVTTADALLTELIMGAGKADTREIPGFGVLLMNPRTHPYRRVLVVADRTQGPMSGLMMYMAALIAVRSPAVLDVLVIGGPGEEIAVEAEFDALAVNREEGLLAAARELCQQEGATVNWIAAGDISDPAALVTAQCSEVAYDLIIDDIGDLAIGGSLRSGIKPEEALLPGAAAAIPYAVLAATDVDLLLVVDEIRVGMISSRLIRIGAVAAAAMAFIAGGAISGSPSEAAPPDIAASAQETRTDLEATTAEIGMTKAREEAANSSSRGSTKAASTPKVSAPKGGATRADVQKAKKSKAKAKANYEEAKAAQKKAQAKAEKVDATLAQAQAEAERAQTEITVAQAKVDQLSQEAVAAHENGDGLAGLLPNAPSKDEIAAADKAVEDAQAWLAEATGRGQEALADLEAASELTPKTDKALAAAEKEVAEAKTEYETAKKKTAVYSESLATARVLPVSKGQFHYTAEYGQRGSAWSRGYHTGLDFAAPTGTNVYAAASGKVVESGYSGAYGYRVMIEHSDGYFTTYNHLSNINVRVGDRVGAGDKIGDVGNTGNSFGSHLHFEVTKGGDGWSSGRFVDPGKWLGI